MFIVRVVVSIFLQKTISSTLFHKYLAGGSHVETFSGIESNGGGDERESDASYDRQEGLAGLPEGIFEGWISDKQSLRKMRCSEFTAGEQ